MSNANNAVQPRPLPTSNDEAIATSHETPTWSNTNVVPGVAANYDPLWDEEVHRKGEGVMARTRDDGGEAAVREGTRTKRKKLRIIVGIVIIFVVVVAAVVGGVVGSKHTNTPYNSGASSSALIINSTGRNTALQFAATTLVTSFTQFFPTYPPPSFTASSYASLINVSEVVTPTAVTTLLSGVTATLTGYPVVVTAAIADQIPTTIYTTTILGGAIKTASFEASVRSTSPTPAASGSSLNQGVAPFQEAGSAS
ncbi:hypothetical protein T439DRAFT_321329 [Meredithblackwellia eburnea MCA 4105]